MTRIPTASEDDKSFRETERGNKSCALPWRRKGKRVGANADIMSRDLILCTDGPSELSKENQDRLAHRIPIREERIARLEGNNGVLEQMPFRR